MPSRGPRSGASVLKTLWLWWSGPGEPDLDLCWRAYLRRFDIQHTFRFVRSALGWTTPALQTPDQADRWTWLIVAAYTQLRLARGLVETNACPENDPATPPNSPQHASAENFADSTQPWAHQPVRRDPTDTDPDARMTPNDRLEPATQPSRKPHDTPNKV